MEQHIKHTYSSERWIEIIKNAGFHIISHKRHLSKTLLQIWDIGLRPIFPLLHKTMMEVHVQRRAALKQEWMNVFKKFIDPLLEAEEQFLNNAEPGFHCFIIEKPCLKDSTRKDVTSLPR